MSERPKPKVNLGPIAIIFQRPTKTDISQWEPLQTIDYLHKIMEQMSEDKIGLVLGSGPNTLKWKKRGWLTLDIDPCYQADFVLDANHLESISQNQFDFILAEYISFDSSAKRGVSSICLLNQVNKILRIGGELIIKTAHKETNNLNLPNKYEYAQLMRNYGFKTIVEVGSFHNIGRGEQTITYYGKKLS